MQFSLRGLLLLVTFECVLAALFGLAFLYLQPDTVFRILRDAGSEFPRARNRQNLANAASCSS